MSPKRPILSTALINQTAGVTDYRAEPNRLPVLNLVTRCLLPDTQPEKPQQKDAKGIPAQQDRTGAADRTELETKGFLEIRNPCDEAREGLTKQSDSRELYAPHSDAAPKTRKAKLTEDRKKRTNPPSRRIGSHGSRTCLQTTVSADMGFGTALCRA